MKFVIVEDEIRIREGIRRLLQKLSPEYIVAGEAENGAEALEIIRRERPDIVITDVMMPVMDGLVMLGELDKEGIQTKAIVLSAYSEFEYARTAMRLGVTEYLIKPIAVNEFTSAIEKIKQQLEKESAQKPEQLGTLEQVLRGVANGGLNLDREVLGYLEEKYQLGVHTPMALLLNYLSEWNPREVNRAEKSIESVLTERETSSWCSWMDNEKKIIWFAVYGYQDAKNLKHRMQSFLLEQSGNLSGRALGWVEVENILCLKERYEKLLDYLDWNIALGDNVVISYPEIKNVQTALCVYPIALESEMKNAISSGSAEMIEAAVAKFQSYFQGKKIYEPRQIKECCIRFFGAVINYSNEINAFDQTGMEQEFPLGGIMSAKTMQELKNASEEIVKRIKTKEEGAINHMQVKRAVALIHEFYQNRVTLEEIAQKLEITPEYLGTQFRKEMGMNFSMYMKNYRIGKAKELLLGTKLNIYEIAEKTGYADAKYFSKVFRKATGYLPAEYRKQYK